MAGASELQRGQGVVPGTCAIQVVGRVENVYIRVVPSTCSHFCIDWTETVGGQANTRVQAF